MAKKKKTDADIEDTESLEAPKEKKITKKSKKPKATQEAENIKNEAEPAPESETDSETEAEAATEAENTEIAQLNVQNDMTIDEMQDFMDDFIKLIAQNDQIQVNLEAVVIVSTAFIQAIISINRYAQDIEKRVIWQHPSSELSDAFNNLGFYSEMMKLEFAA